MKKIKLMFLVAFLSVASYAGYSAYDYVTMSDAERFFLANIEALTTREPDGGIPPQRCYQSFKAWNGEPVRYEHHFVCVGGSYKCEVSLPMIEGSFSNPGTCHI